MGLDIVEMIMGVEEEFDLPIPDEVAAGLITPGHVRDHLLARLPVVPSEGCRTQRTFYGLKRGFGAALPLADPVTPRTRLDRLADRKSWTEVWTRVRNTAGRRSWPEDVPFRDRLHPGPATLRELTYYVAMHATEPLEGEHWTREGIEIALRRVVWDQFYLLDFRMGDDWYRDMGLD